MFRTVPLSIIRSFSLYTQQRYMSYSFGDGLRAEVRGIRPAKNLVSSRFFWTGYERSRQWYSPFTACCLHYIPPGWTFRKSTFCPHTVFVCFVWIWEQTAIISLYSINWLVFITEAVCLLRGTDYFLLERKLMIFITQRTWTVIVLPRTLSSLTNLANSFISYFPTFRSIWTVSAPYNALTQVLYIYIYM